MSNSPKPYPISGKKRPRKASATSSTPRAEAPIAQGLYDPFHEHDSCGTGFIVQLKGVKSHKIIEDGLKALENLNHRGACGCEVNTGDGAGVLIQIPHNFFAHVCAHEGIRLPQAGRYGVGLFFAARDKAATKQAMRIFQNIVEEQGQQLIGWRSVPTNNASLGASALVAEPDMFHVIVGRSPGIDEDTFERRLYVIRKLFENQMAREDIQDAATFYFPSLSSRTLVYKGMLMATQLREYFPDLSDPRMMSALCMFHSRFSTNTFPSWKLAHPYRMIAHNGEINTLRGNINWMRAREGLFESQIIPDIQRITPIIDDKGSDTACFDNALELLMMAGRPIHQAVMMMIPEPWDGHESMSQEKKDFYRYHGCLMEPWDGPASITFTDGRTIGAVLDRNGLRPSRYYVTKDDYVIMASEVGVLPIAPENVLHKGRLQPGRMFLISLDEGRIIDDAELKHKVATANPYGEWLKANMLRLEDLPAAEPAPRLKDDALLQQQMAFGYSTEDLKYILGPMARNGEEARGSMGTDTPLAVLSDKPQLLYNYFKQLFAQVTNPPLDAIREQLVTSVNSTLGPEGDLLDPEPSNARMIEVKSPFLTNDELAKLKAFDDGFHRAKVLPTIFHVEEGPKVLERAMEELCRQADEAISEGYTMLILSDRDVDAEHAPIPALLATAGVHNHLVRERKRTQVGLIIETAEAREGHHYALLIGYGAGAINPYLALDTLHQMADEGILETGIGYEEALEHYLKAIKKATVKIMSKMGISTIHSYRGAQIFEAIGLEPGFVDRYFTNTASRIAGIGIEEVALDTLFHHKRAFPEREGGLKELLWGGQYQWRRDGEFHLFNPETVFKLQHSTRTGQQDIFRQYTRMVDDQAERLCTLRGLFEIKSDREPVPLEEVEPAEPDVPALRHRRYELRLDQRGGARDAGDRDEPHRRQVQHRRRRRRPPPLHP